MLLLPREKAFNVCVGLATGIMLLRCVFPFWDGVLDGNKRNIATIVSMRVHIFMANYKDAEALSDPAKSVLLTAQERRFAEPLRKLPCFADWCHFNLFLPF